MSNTTNKSVVDNKGNSITNSAYQLVQCVMENVSGQRRDIRNMVAYTRIHESLFSPALVCEVGIRDETNFLEEFTSNQVIIINLLDPKHLRKYTLILTHFYCQLYHHLLNAHLK